MTTSHFNLRNFQNLAYYETVSFWSVLLSVIFLPNDIWHTYFLPCFMLVIALSLTVNVAMKRRGIIQKIKCLLGHHDWLNFNNKTVKMDNKLLTISFQRKCATCKRREKHVDKKNLNELWKLLKAHKDK